VVLLAATVLAGCGQPTVAPNNLRLTVTLRTAISARNADWLEKNSAQIAERYAAGQMSGDEFAAFEAIVVQARAGEWEDAERAVVDLQEAQRPTDEQVQRVRLGRASTN